MPVRVGINGFGRIGRNVLRAGMAAQADDAAKHLEAGARKVVISAPAKGEDLPVVLGVNFDTDDREAHDVISNASCRRTAARRSRRWPTRRSGSATGS